MTELNYNFVKYSPGDYYTDDHYTCTCKEANTQYHQLDIHGGPTLFCPYYTNEQAMTLCKWYNEGGGE